MPNETNLKPFKLSTLKQALTTHAHCNLAFVLPDGNAIPVHAHITEVGRLQKRFLDCGGKLRNLTFASFQIWVADDTEHRLPAGKLAAICEQAADILGSEDLEVQVECQVGSISLFSIGAFEVKDDLLIFSLENKSTACLALEVCVPSLSGEDSCCSPKPIQAEENCCSPRSKCC